MIFNVLIYDFWVNVPGPGAYRLPSDFGYYESSKIAHSKIVESVVEEVIMIINNLN